MANNCKNCIHYNREGNTIELPNGEEIEQSGFIPNVGTGGEEIAKCSNNSNFWENITRDASTNSFFDSAEKKKVMNYVGTLGVGEKDTCPLFAAIEVTQITVTGTGSIDYVDNTKTLQMIAAVLPSNAADITVVWSIQAGGTGTATIDSNGLLTGTSTGTVIVRATANDGSGVYGEMTVNVVVLVATIAVTGFGGATTVANGANLTMVAVVGPLSATNQNVLWTVTNGTGSAAIDELSGVLTGASLGTVTVKATAIDGSEISGSTVITII